MMIYSKEKSLKVWPIIVLPFLWFCQTNVSAQDSHFTSNSIRQNAVKITSTFEDNSRNTAFGFVFSEDGDFLNIVTVFDVIMSGFHEIARKTTIYFYDGYSTSDFELIKFIAELNLALIRIEKPANYNWYPYCKSVAAAKNDIVWILGRYAEWNDPIEEYVGQVSEVSGKEIRVDFSHSKIGILGAPLIDEGKIAGFVVNDQGFQATVLPIRRIQLHVYYWLNLKWKDYALRLPYFILGGSSGIMYPITNSSGGGTILPPNYNSLFFELGIYRNFSICFQGSSNEIASGKARVFEQIFQSRNRFITYTLLLQLSEKSRFFDKGYGNGFLGYSFGHQSPELKVNEDHWKRLKDIEGFNFEYPENIHSLILGASSNIIFSNHLMVGFECGFRYITSKYISINPLEPFKENKRNDWTIYIKLRFGLVLGNRKIVYKHLR
jgi:hypothetical protein